MKFLLGEIVDFIVEASIYQRSGKYLHTEIKK